MSQSEVYKQTLRERRLSLIKLMGGECELCGEKDEKSLEFDHRNGRDYHPNKISRAKRLELYRRDYNEGKVRLLCKSCNCGYRPVGDGEPF